ncbi:MAG TPA: hypothetical protein VNM67_06875 [Thermoanaerobaculia bacterium]|nr:hypothetical protein [Thermoanaerobaculia bacterium]
MGINVKDFVGTWYVWWADGEKSVMKPGSKLVLGTGEDGATAPELTPEFQVVMGFALLGLTPGGTWAPIFSSQEQEQQPLQLMFVDGTLGWLGYYKGKPLRIYISACEANVAGSQRSVALYGSSVLGDPDQVGVWGASDRPPGG